MASPQFPKDCPDFAGQRGTALVVQHDLSGVDGIVDHVLASIAHDARENGDVEVVMPLERGRAIRFRHDADADATTLVDAGVDSP